MQTSGEVQHSSAALPATLLRTLGLCSYFWSVTIASSLVTGRALPAATRASARSSSRMDSLYAASGQIPMHILSATAQWVEAWITWPASSDERSWGSNGSSFSKSALPTGDPASDPSDALSRDMTAFASPWTLPDV